MKKILFVTALTLFGFTVSAISEPEIVANAETTDVAPLSSTAYFEVHRPYSNAPRIWHSATRNGVSYSGYLYYLREYWTSGGMRVVYAGRLRGGPFVETR